MRKRSQFINHAFLLLAMAAAFTLAAKAEAYEPPIFDLANAPNVTLRTPAIDLEVDGTYSVETGEQVDLTGSASITMPCVAIFVRMDAAATSRQVLEVVGRTSDEGHLTNDAAMTSATEKFLIPVSYAEVGPRVIVFPHPMRYVNLRIDGDDTTNLPNVDIMGVTGTSRCPLYLN